MDGWMEGRGEERKRTPSLPLVDRLIPTFGGPIDGLEILHHEPGIPIVVRIVGTGAAG